MSISEKFNIAYLALGANVDNAFKTRFEFLCFAIKQLEENEDIHVLKCSKVYETLPVGYLDQTNFLNCVIEIQTTLTAIELLRFCKLDIELKSGRTKIIENGPRTIDIDILFYNDEEIYTNELVIPHPRIYERAFVLVPLNDIATKKVGNIMQYELVDTIEGVSLTKYDLDQYLQDLVIKNHQKRST